MSAPSIREKIDEELKHVYIPTLAIEKIKFDQNVNQIDDGNFGEMVNDEIKIAQGAKTCIVLGTGGVGKTSISSAIAISRARTEPRASSILSARQHVALLTVDPARRLGVALGLEDTASRESHLNANTFKPLPKEESTLSVFQLDAKKEFFDLLKQTLSDENYEKCKINSFVHAISTMGIINEFMAIEAMHRLSINGEFDLVVVDTPPSHTIFDLLDAPAVLQRVFRSSVFHALTGNNAVTNFSTAVAMRTIFRPLMSLVGMELIEDTIFFLKQVRDVEKVFSEHCDVVQHILKQSSTSYVGVCNPSSSSREQIYAVCEQMSERASKVDNIVVNGFSKDGGIAHIEIDDFAKRVGDLGSNLSVVEECDFDDPAKIVSAIAEYVKWSI